MKPRGARVTELLAPVALVLGAGGRLAALAIACIMLAAASTPSAMGSS